MKYPSQEEVERIKKMYPPGTVIKLIRMDDDYAPPEGTIGTVDYIDDIGTLHMKWETGSSLGIIVDGDDFEVIKD